MKRTNLPKQSPELKSALQEAIDLVRPIVQKIERGPQLTKDHYAAYMQALGQGKTDEDRRRLALCFIAAGANIEGIRTALKMLNG